MYIAYFSELDRITDLTLSHNCLDSLPNSIGRLKRLNILKVDDNNLTRLTPAIGSCTGLTELLLMQNLLSDIPSSIGNLNALSNLNLDKNQISTIPQLVRLVAFKLNVILASRLETAPHSLFFQCVTTKLRSCHWRLENLAG